MIAETRLAEGLSVILIWRGRGLLAVVALLPVLGSCVGLMNIEPAALCLTAVGLALVLGGWFCAYYGRLWNRGGAHHTLYFVRLEVWGGIYLALAILPAGAICALGGATLVGAIPRGRDGGDRNEFLYMAAGGAVVLFAACAALYSAAKVLRSRQWHMEDEDEEDERESDRRPRRDRDSRYFDRD